MKASATFFVFLSVFFCGCCPACKIESFDLNWLCVNGSALILQANCCASLYATLQFRVNNAVLNTSEELKERGITFVASTGDCVNVTVDNLPANVNGSLAAQCNAEKGDSTCNSQLQMIESPQCSSTGTAAMENFTEQTAHMENPTGTTSENPETLSDHVETNTTHDATTDENTQGDSMLTIVATISVIGVSIITAIACILLLACYQHLKKRKSHDLSLEQNGSLTVAPKSNEKIPLQPVSDKNTPCQLVSRSQNPLPVTMHSRNDDSTIDIPPPLQEDTLLPSFYANLEEGNLTQSISPSAQCTDDKTKDCGSQVYVTHNKAFFANLK